MKITLLNIPYIYDKQALQTVHNLKKKKKYSLTTLFFKREQSTQNVLH